MISFEEALDIVKSNIPDPVGERILLSLANGRVLAEDIVCDQDIPSFNKSAVDGFACRRADLHGPLKVIETIPAGKEPGKKIGAGQCARIMTGAMVPEGADCVVMIEDTEEQPGGNIRCTTDKVSQNIRNRAEDLIKGTLVLKKGSLIRPQEIALLATVGAVNPLVFRQPVIGIASTGDELVEPDKTPGISQIRDSNGMQLLAQMEQMGIRAKFLGILPDVREKIRKAIEISLHGSDILILSGGVSMGDFDHIPEVMKDLGMQILFKSLAIQPGRPTVLARKGNQFVWGLPGNPVSAFVLFELLVKTHLFAWMEYSFEPLIIRLPLGRSYSRKKSSRLSWLPVKIHDHQAWPVEYHGSAHIHAYTSADALLPVPIGVTEIVEGTMVEVRVIQ
ncbi:MAG: molybdopterin molybdotransferase MoeA [Bacteroidetes bacterium]|nr:molybdopterin molybdotransferase MoeA [Bacteroidota bacterium]